MLRLFPGDTKGLADWVREAMRFIDLTEADCLGYSDQGMAEDAAILTARGYALFGVSLEAADTCLARLDHAPLMVMAQHADALQEIMAALYKAWPHAEDMGDGTYLGIVGLIEQLTAERNALLEALKAQTAVSVRSMRRLGFLSEQDILDCTAQSRAAIELVTGDDQALDKIAWRISGFARSSEDRVSITLTAPQARALEGLWEHAVQSAMGEPDMERVLLTAPAERAIKIVRAALSREAGHDE